MVNVDATSSHAAELRDRTINCSDRILKSRTWAIYPGCQDEVWLLGGGGGFVVMLTRSQVPRQPLEFRFWTQLLSLLLQ